MINQTLSRRSFSRLIGVSAAYTALRPITKASGSTRATMRRLVSSAPNVVRLSSNENPYGPAPAALKAMTDGFTLAWRYPDEHADMLYELAGQVVRHLQTYLSEKDAGQVLALHQREIARAVHAQMQDHFWKDDTVEYHHEVRQGWTEFKESACEEDSVLRRPIPRRLGHHPQEVRYPDEMRRAVLAKDDIVASWAGPTRRV